MNAREERLLTPQTIAAVDEWLDKANVFAKGYWQYVDGKLTVVGLRIGQDWNRVVAFFGDTVVRHEDGSHSVLSAKDAAELAKLRARVAELPTQSPRVRTDELVPGDRVWHPYDMACFTVAEVASEGSTSRLRFHNRVTDENESGMRVTGTDDNGETVHVDTAPSYLWTREDTTSEMKRLQARIAELLAERHSTNEALSDATETLRVQRDRIAELEAAAEKVAGFCAKRAEYVDNLRNCSPNNDHDYNRWQGHAESRRQLSQLLGLPVGWPADDKPVPARQPEDPHDGPLHHDYAVPRDLPFIPGQTTGRCPQGHTFEDCTCGGDA